MRPRMTLIDNEASYPTCAGELAARLETLVEIARDYTDHDPVLRDVIEGAELTLKAFKIKVAANLPMGVRT